MNGTEYIENAQKTTREDLDDVNHYVLGIMTEAGEVAHLHKADIIYGKTYTREEMLKEVGDLTWYIANLIRLMGSSWEEVWAMNIEKLRRRYPEGFTEEAAQAKEKAKGR